MQRHGTVIAQTARCEAVPEHTACPAGGPGEVLMVQQPEGHCRDSAPAAGIGAAAAPACLHLQVKPACVYRSSLPASTGEAGLHLQVKPLHLQVKPLPACTYK